MNGVNMIPIAFGLFFTAIAGPAFIIIGLVTGKRAPEQPASPLPCGVYSKMGSDVLHEWGNNCRTDKDRGDALREMFAKIDGEEVQKVTVFSGVYEMGDKPAIVKFNGWGEIEAENANVRGEWPAIEVRKPETADERMYLRMRIGRVGNDQCYARGYTMDHWYSPGDMHINAEKMRTNANESITAELVTP